MPAGYSKRSLVDKLGIRPGMRLVLMRPPKGYDRTLGPLPEGVVAASRLRKNLDFIQFFSTSRPDLAKSFPKLKKALKPAGILWISWPKRASGVPTDLTGDVVRKVGLDNGLVDVKVCAVDETWSGLKFVYRLEDR